MLEVLEETFRSFDTLELTTTRVSCTSLQRLTRRQRHLDNAVYRHFPSTSRSTPDPRRRAQATKSLPAESFLPVITGRSRETSKSPREKEKKNRVYKAGK